VINALTNKNFVEELNIPYFQKIMGERSLKEYFASIATDRYIAENGVFHHF